MQWQAAAGGGSWADLQGQDGALSTATTAVANTGLVGGASYLFRVRAKNTHGWGAYSSELSVLVSGVPDQPSAPTTALSNLDVRVSWTAPGANFGGITAYELAIEDTNGARVTESTYCDGSTEPVFSERFCAVPMAHLWSAYGLVLGDLVAASVRAYGVNGWSAWSPSTASGVTVETVPTQMAAPSEGSLTNEF